MVMSNGTFRILRSCCRQRATPRFSSVLFFAARRVIISCRVSFLAAVSQGADLREILHKRGLAVIRVPFFAAAPPWRRPLRFMPPARASERLALSDHRLVGTSATWFAENSSVAQSAESAAILPYCRHTWPQSVSLATRRLISDPSTSTSCRTRTVVTT